MKTFTNVLGAAGCAVLLMLASHVHAADAKLWQTYCDDARKATGERRYAEADQFMSKALGVAEQFGAADLRLVETLFLAAELQRTRKQFAEAEPHLRRALALREAKLGTNHLSVAECVYYVGQNLTDQRKLTEAEPLLKRAEHIYKWKNGTYDMTVGKCQAALARNCFLAGRLDEADKLYTAALKILGHQSSSTQFTGANTVQETVFVPNYRRVMQIRLEHAQTLHAAKRYPAAEAAFKQLVKLIEDRESKTSDLLLNPLLAFGQHYTDVKKFAAAEALLLRRQAILANHGGEQHPGHLPTLAALERVYREQGKTTEAEALARQLAAAGVKPAAAK